MIWQRDLLQSAADMRQEFDLAFAQPPLGAAAGLVDLLLVGVASHRYAVRLAHVMGVHALGRVVTVPSPDPKLRGLAGLRGNVVPVFDLALGLGHARAEEPSWLLELRSAEPCALAFTDLFGHLRLPAGELAPPSPEAAATHRLASGSALTSAGPTPIIDLLAVYTELTGPNGFPPSRESEGLT